MRAGEPLDVKGFWHGQPQGPSGFLSGGGAGLFDGLEDATHSLFDELRQVLGGEVKVVEQHADPCRSFVGVGAVAGHRGGRIAGRGHIGAGQLHSVAGRCPTGGSPVAPPSASDAARDSVAAIDTN